MPLASLDGEVLPLAEARLPVTDEGLLRGDGVFEVVRLYGGRPFALDEHLARMARSAANLRLEFDADVLRAEAEALLGAGEPGDGLLRLVVTRGGHRLALLEPLPARRAAASLGLVEYVPSRVLDEVKSLSYAGNMLATRLARDRGFDEALLVSPHGRLLEAPTSTFFLVAAGRVRTPPLSERVLDSITRRRVLEAVDVVEESLTVDDLPRASAAFLASTTREVQAVDRVEDVAFDPGDGVVADVAARVHELIAAAV